MGVLSSIRGLVSVLQRDFKLTCRGVWPGWFTLTHYRGRLRARSNRPGGAASTSVRVNGSRVRIFLTTTHIGPFFGIFAEKEYDIRGAGLGFAPLTVLDLGANAGMATAYLSACYPEARFLCVEPDPRNLPLIEKTIAANRISATVAPVAVAAEAGRLLLRMGDDPTCSALESSQMHDLPDGVEVEVQTVPQLLAGAGWSGVDLVKIDIEGTERELLSRNNEWLANTKALVLEIHPNTSAEEIGGFLTPFGFRLERFGHGNEPVYLAKRS